MCLRAEVRNGTPGGRSILSSLSIDLVPARRGQLNHGRHNVIKRSTTIRGAVCALGILALAAARPARAQEPTHYTFVSFWAVPRAQWAAFEKSQAETDSILEGLVADGTLVCWGSAVALVHTEDGYTHSDWFVSDTQAGIVKTLDALRNVGRAQSLVNTTKHRDVMLHSIAHGGKTARTTSGYIRVAFWEAKPGRGDNGEEIFKKYIQPDLDAGVADGSVLMYKCAGINRSEAEDERALRERSSDPLGLEFCTVASRGAQR